jgi:hypothetical protein
MLQALFLYSLVIAQSLTSAESLRLAPSVVADFELGKDMKGSRLRQLAWSPDHSQIYLMTYEPNRDASVKEAFHYLIPVAGGDPKRVEARPDWAETYWDWKSHHTAPDASMKIEVAQEKRRQNAVAVPFGGDAARGGVVDPATSGLSQESALEAARAMQNDDVYMLRLKGEIVGEWVNHPIVPGLTFGWGPKNSGLIAFAEVKSGRLVLMDRAGDKQKVDGTKNVVLPAWTEDGARLAYLEGRGRNKYALVIAAVGR